MTNGFSAFGVRGGVAGAGDGAVLGVTGAGVGAGVGGVGAASCVGGVASGVGGATSGVGFGPFSAIAPAMPMPL
jgi:hypothetical protein